MMAKVETTSTPGDKTGIHSHRRTTCCEDRGSPVGICTGTIRIREINPREVGNRLPCSASRGSVGVRPDDTIAAAPRSALGGVVRVLVVSLCLNIWGERELGLDTFSLGLEERDGFAVHHGEADAFGN
jgi:hypothetical protein